MVARPRRLEVRGPAAEELFGWLDGSKRPVPLECLVEGPAGSGKTRMILEFLYAYARMNPGSRILMMRDRRVDMSSTVLVEWEQEVLGPKNYMVLKGPTREHREKYTLRNGSEIVLGGFNNELKLFSGQYHGIYFNECTETVERKWETLHRALRAKGGPFRFFIGDCNPEDSEHWLNKRCDAGQTKRLKVFLWDNPRFYQEGRWTPDGREYAKRLRSSLTGANYQRLYMGQWVPSEGLVWPEYSPEVHRIYGRMQQRGGIWFLVLEGSGPEERRTIEMRSFVLSMDVGYRSPGVLQAWGVDGEGAMYRVAEYYHKGWTHADWASRAVTLAKRYSPEALVSDHDAALIEALNRALRTAGHSAIARPADKKLGKKERIEMFRTRLQQRRAFFLRDAVLEPDAQLQRDRMPWCTETEIGSWTWREHTVGDDPTRQADEPDPYGADHGCDASMYAEAYVWGRIRQRTPVVAAAPGTYGFVFDKHRKPAEKPLWR